MELVPEIVMAESLKEFRNRTGINLYRIMMACRLLGFKNYKSYQTYLRLKFIQDNKLREKEYADKLKVAYSRVTKYKKMLKNGKLEELENAKISKAKND